ncbi:hypothetical protein [Xaviernesmea oryzae]|nr:hypothetical protein [Xaviernesmea oryzae]
MRALTRLPAPALILGFGLALIALAGFRGWLAHGADMMLVFGQSGLSWCF